MRLFRLPILCASALAPVPALAHGTTKSSANAEAEQQRDIIVTGARQKGSTATKTDTPIIETPQPITVIDDELYLAQGAVSIGDKLNYVAGVTANPYGPDSRVDGALVRGINALQFRDGMRDIFSYYASIRADPYNFDQIKLHSDAKGVPVLTFVNGSDLDDPAKLLKGKSLSRTVKIASGCWLETHGTALGDLLRQSYAIMQERWDGHTSMRTLGPDQASP